MLALLRRPTFDHHLFTMLIDHKRKKQQPIFYVVKTVYVEDLVEVTRWRTEEAGLPLEPSSYLEAKTRATLKLHPMEGMFLQVCYLF